jgi:hypothetical protein
MEPKPLDGQAPSKTTNASELGALSEISPSEIPPSEIPPSELAPSPEDDEHATLATTKSEAIAAWFMAEPRKER